MPRATNGSEQPSGKRGTLPRPPEDSREFIGRYVQSSSSRFVSPPGSWQPIPLSLGELPGGSAARPPAPPPHRLYPGRNAAIEDRSSPEGRRVGA